MARATTFRYGRGDSIDFVVGYSDVDSGTVQQLFNVSGAGLIVLGRYNFNLNRIDDYEHKISLGLDYKAFQNRVLTTGWRAACAGYYAAPREHRLRR